MTCPYSHNKNNFEESYPTPTADSAARAFGAPPPGLKMVNMTQDSVPNPFQQWLDYDDCGAFGDRVASVALRDIRWSENFLSRTCVKIVAVHEWISIFWRSIFAFVQKWFDAWGSRGQRFVHKVIVMWCYSGGTEPMASIVGLIPPATVMFEQKWPEGKGKGRPRANGKKTGDLLNKIDDLPDNLWLRA